MELTIQQLVAIAKSEDEEQKNIAFSFGIFPNKTAQQISSLTQINIIGAIRLLKPYGIAHTITWHGNMREFERGQIPVYDTDFDLIPTIVDEYDLCERASNDKRGNPSIYFHKIINQVRYTVCMTYTARKERYSNEMIKKLSFSTMYKKPALKKPIIKIGFL